MIALGLMAFVLLLILAMSTLVQVESNSSEISRAKMESEQNAILALQVAVGKLQSFAGPDQRVSARADILTDLSTSSGAPHQEKAYLTGIWSTEPVANGTGAIQSLGWLVSGAPDVSVTPDWYQTAWDDEAVIVVGENTADNNTNSGDVNTSQVKAGKVPLEDSLGAVAGHYAYWVGDENIKAKVNMVESDEQLAANPTAEAEFNRLHSIQRIDPNILEAGSGLDYTNADERRSLERVFSRGLFDSIDHNGGDFLRTGFHDYSIHSKGLLTNTLDGGLKTDLSRGLSDQPLSGPVYDDSGDDKPAPNWETIASYYNLDDAVSANQVSVRAQTDTSHGLTPVILGADLFSGVYFESIGLDTYQLNGIIWTAVVLHNPYDVALAPTDYIFESNNLPEELPNKKFRFYLIRDGVFDPNVHHYVIEDNIQAATGTTTRFVRYQTSEPIGFEPGEVKVLCTQLPSNFDIDGIYDYASMPDGAKVMQPGYLETVGFLKVPLTINRGPDNKNGIYTTADLFSDDGAGGLTPNQLRFYLTAYLSLKVFAVENGQEAYIGGISSGGVGGGASVTDMTRDIIPDQPIGGQGAVVRTLLPRSSGGYGYRLLADFNYRAMMDPNVDPGILTVPTPVWQTGPIWNGAPVNTHPHAIQYDPSNGYSAYAGRSIFDDGMSENVFFTVPRQKLFSLGDLRHVNLRKDRYQDTTAAYGQNDISIPSYVIGNSWASHFMPLDEADYTYRVNEALWDQYFFSSIPQNTSDWSEPFPNARIVTDAFDPSDSAQEDAILDRDTASEHLAVDGAFNVNSTSVVAWRALLGGLSGIVEDPDTPGQTLDNIFPRITNWMDEDYQSGDISGGNVANIPRMWSGFRSLTDAELDELAEEIVEEVRLRGPFPSLASFVNRTLVDLDPVTTPDPAPAGESSRLRILVDQHDTRLKGTLQAAIDRVDVNADGLPDINEDLRQADFQDSLGNVVKTPSPGSGIGSPLGIIDSQAQRSFPPAGQPPVRRPDYRQNSRGLFSTDAPGFLSQMDLLSALGPLLTVRSDTFTIRSYGDAVNPVTGETSRSWCVAVVQRTTEPLNRAAPEAGRLFKIVSFRWLSDDEV